MGSAGGLMREHDLAQARELGRQIARRGAIIITGACPGLPHEAVLGAREVGTFVLGVSPALCLEEHISRYHSPHEEYDALVFTGSGLMGREIETIRSSHIVCVVGGRSGTLGEFAIAYDEGKLIAVLQGTGGIADCIDQIVAMIHKDTGADVIYDHDPRALIDRAMECHEDRVRRGVAHCHRIPDG